MYSKIVMGEKNILMRSFAVRLERKQNVNDVQAGSEIEIQILVSITLSHESVM